MVVRARGKRDPSVARAFKGLLVYMLSPPVWPLGVGEQGRPASPVLCVLARFRGRSERPRNRDHLRWASVSGGSAAKIDCTERRVRAATPPIRRRGARARDSAASVHARRRACTPRHSRCRSTERLNPSSRLPRRATARPNLSASRTGQPRSTGFAGPIHLAPPPAVHRNSREARSASGSAPPGSPLPSLGEIGEIGEIGQELITLGNTGCI